jgi:hypothetical protein
MVQNHIHMVVRNFELLEILPILVCRYGPLSSQLEVSPYGDVCLELAALVCTGGVVTLLESGLARLVVVAAQDGTHAHAHLVERCWCRV